MTSYVVRGGRGIGVNPEGLDYPFLNPSEDIQGLLADVYLSHEVHTAVLPLRIDWMYGFDTAFGYPPPVVDALTPSGLDDGEIARPTVNVAGAVDVRPASIVTPAAAIPSPIVIGPYPPITNVVDLRILDANDVVIFDSTTATYYRAINFGDRLRIHEWRNADAVCRVVQHTAFEDVENFKIFPTVIIPESSILDERTAHLLPKRVNSVRAAAVTTSEAIRFRGGYNVNLFSGVDPRPQLLEPNITPVLRPGQAAAAAPGERLRTRITISADPGDGDGRFKKCLETDLPIRTINNVGPDEYGNFILAATQCYWIRRPATITNGAARFKLVNNEVPVGGPSGQGSTNTASTLQIGNDCTPCCECADYMRVYKGVTNVHNQYGKIGKTATKTRDTYKESITRWKDQKTCRAASPARVAMAATPSGTDLLLDVAVALCNTSDECDTASATLVFTASCSPSGGSGGGTIGSPSPANPDNCNVAITTSSNPQRQPHQLAGTWPNYTVNWGSVNPGHAVNVRARFSFACDDIDGCTVTATATPTVGGTVGTPTSASLALDCGDCA
jgi:hypothetical protein